MSRGHGAQPPGVTPSPHSLPHTPRGVNQQALRRLNEVALMRELRIRGPLSRVELADRLGLDTKTLTNLSRHLMGKGFVEAAGMASAGRGRPREMLQLQSTHLSAIGLHLEEYRLSGAVIGLDGSIRERLTRRFTGKEDQRRLVAMIRDMARQLTQAAGGRAIGAGLTIPGVVDHRTGTVVASAHLPQWVGVRVGTLLEGVYDGPLRVEEFTRAKALAEHWFGACVSVDNFILLDVGVGIACAVVMDGRLHTGATQLAGEIGHTVVLPGGDLCTCGQRGCLETVASLEAVAKCAGVSKGAAGGVFQDGIAAALRKGSPAARRAVEDAGLAIGRVLSALVGALNPSHVVLTGDALVLDPLFSATVREAVIACTLPALARDLTIVPSRLQDLSALLGAAVLGLQSFFEA